MALGQMQASAAHEFGHALGIDGHSTNPHDLNESLLWQRYNFCQTMPLPSAIFII